MYFRTCGWVCLQSLIFPCLVFVLVLGRGGAPERWPSHRTEQSKPRRPLPSIPPWSWRFRLSRVLVKAPEDQPSHTLQRLPFFWYYNLCWIFHSYHLFLQNSKLVLQSLDPAELTFRPPQSSQVSVVLYSSRKTCRLRHLGWTLRQSVDGTEEARACRHRLSESKGFLMEQKHFWKHCSKYKNSDVFWCAMSGQTSLKLALVLSCNFKRIIWYWYILVTLSIPFSMHWQRTSRDLPTLRRTMFSDGILEAAPQTTEQEGAVWQRYRSSIPFHVDWVWVESPLFGLV